MPEFQSEEEVMSHLRALGMDETNFDPSKIPDIATWTLRGQPLIPQKSLLGAGGYPSAQAQQPTGVPKGLSYAAAPGGPGGGEFGIPSKGLLSYAATAISPLLTPGVFARSVAGAVQPEAGGLPTVSAEELPPRAGAAPVSPVAPVVSPEPVPEEVFEEAAVPPQAPGDFGFTRGRGIYEMGLGLGQMQAGATALDPRESLGGFFTYLGGMADISVPRGMEDTAWGQLGPIFASIGTGLNLLGQTASAERGRQFQVDLQEDIGRALVFMDTI